MVTLRELRVRRRLTMKELADLVGVSESVIYRAEAGESTPRFRVQRRIAEVFGIEPDAIEYGQKTTTGPGGRPPQRREEVDEDEGRRAA